jgi:hypothetical protein
MKHSRPKTLDALFPAETLLVVRGVGEEWPRNNQESGVTQQDYSEEAIPERDPAYRLPDGTISDTNTVEYLPAEQRLSLARCLEQLGMPRARAEFIANL